MRPWPTGVEIPDPWEAPPCGGTTERLVVDLACMQVDTYTVPGDIPRLAVTKSEITSSM